MDQPPWISAAAMHASVTTPDCVDALSRALLDGLRPADQPRRVVHAVAGGELMTMPSAFGDRAGVKVVGIGSPAGAGHSAAAGTQPRIQALYLLLDAVTLAPLALLDGSALTAIRTAAVSALAVQQLAEPAASRLVVFGSGPQAQAHISALRAVRPIAEVRVVGRTRERAQRFLDEIELSGVDAAAGTASDVAFADLVVCATTAGEPLFDGGLVASHCCVVAVGSHQPHRRELDSELLRSAHVVVEDAAVALAEAGDVVLAIADGALDSADLIPLAELVTGHRSVPRGRPRVFKSVGMAWQDLVVAAEIHRRRETATSHLR